MAAIISRILVAMAKISGITRPAIRSSMASSTQPWSPLTKVNMKEILATYDGFKDVNTLVDLGEGTEKR
jgi:hypothetical protein